MSLKALQDYTFVSKYARYNEELKRRETWDEAVDRVKEMHLEKYPQKDIKEDIEWAFDRVREKRVLGSQRALQFGGKPILKKNARIYNCISSYCDRLRFFQEAFWLLLCGTGVGFSAQTHHIAKLSNFIPRKNKSKLYVIPDSIEGWADSLGVLMSSYFGGGDFTEYAGYDVEFNYSLIRPEGSKLGSSSGKAPGPVPLQNALEKIAELLNRCIKSGSQKLRPIDAYDIVMHTSDAVLSGGVRRSATLCMFSPDDIEMATAKSGNWFNENPQRGRSNNSALLLREDTTYEQFVSLMESVKEYGEPGFIWSDSLEGLFNPCVEVNLYAYDEYGNSGWQACNLCEINGKKVKTEEDFAIAAKAAAIIGTLQAGYTNFEYLGAVSERIIRKEALLGVSITGMMDSPEILFDPKLQRKMAKLILKVNEIIAAKIGINKCARGTCNKPAGCQRKETMLITDQGILTLEELGDIDGKQWQNHNINIFNGSKTEYSNKFYIQGLSKTKKFLTQSGQVLESTYIHQYKIFKNGELVWMKARDIKEGDVIPYVCGGYEKFDIDEVKLNSIKYNHFNSNGLKQPKFLNEDLAWLIGLYTGDGSNHKRSIRIHGDKNKPKDLEKAQRIVKEQFSLSSKIIPDRRGEGRLTLVINSKPLILWLECNKLKKSKSPEITIPQLIRKSSIEVIKSFIDGYWTADGSLSTGSKNRNWVTTSFEMSQQLVSVLRAVGQDCSVRNMPPTASSKGKRMRYWIQERKGRKGNYHKSPWGSLYKEFDKVNLEHMTPDIVVAVEDSENYTFDIEVPNEHTYLANSYVSHNTTSCILGTASGIHPHHARRYIRRSQGNKLEAPLQYFKTINPNAVEKSVWSANGTDEVIAFCVEVPKGAKIKNDLDATTLLEYVKLTQQNWVMAGTRTDKCVKKWLHHNVSNTITVRDGEWEEVAKFIYKNKQYFAGISLLPQSGDKDYPQAPFTAIYTPTELAKIYGDGMPMASGLVVDGLHEFDNNLWVACDEALGVTSLEEPNTSSNDFTSFQAHDKWAKQKDWCRRVQQFADRYLEGDVRQATYLMKDVHNWKLWCDLQREYKDVDYTLLHENEDNTKLLQESGCSGGKCTVEYA